MEGGGSVGARIKRFRAAHGYTQAQLASMLRVSESAVRMWELDRNEPDIKTINRLSAIFGVTPNDLIADAPVPVHDIYAEYGLDAERDAPLYRLMADVKKEEIDEADLRLVLDFIKKARQREDDAAL